jgi:pimeloyl-ACP methyl ester carboxylesterase
MGVTSGLSASSIQARPLPLTAGGHRLEAFWIGPPPGRDPILVFLHEGLGSAGALLKFATAVSEATGRGALVYSRVGYGASDPAPLPFPVRFMHDEASVLSEVLDVLEIEAAILVGHSDGASIALIHAAGPGAGRIRGLVLLAPHSFVEPITISSIAALPERFQHGDLRSRLERLHGKNTDHIFQGWTEVWLRPEFRAWTIEDLLPSVTCPVLVIQGADDEYGTIRQVEAIAMRAGGPVETLVLSDCGHAPHRDRRDVALTAIERFVSELPAPPEPAQAPPRPPADRR